MYSRIVKMQRTVRLCAVLALVHFAFLAFAADSPWQQARIVEVKTSVDTRTSTWIVNTPIQSEETVCVIRIHIKDKLLQGIYTLDKSQPAPPTEWVKHARGGDQLVGDLFFFLGRFGRDYKLRVVSTKSAVMLDPWTQKEVTAEKAAAMTEEANHSMIGFDEKADAPEKPAAAAAPAPAPAEPAPPPAPEPPTGVVSISSVPYLAEVFVDGESMGYTPAKLKLAPGKHSFRCEKAGYKPWTKDITVTQGSELTLDATLNR